MSTETDAKRTTLPVLAMVIPLINRRRFWLRAQRLEDEPPKPPSKLTRAAGSFDSSGFRVQGSSRVKNGLLQDPMRVLQGS